MTKICAEIGLAHGGSFDRAIEYIRVAKQCGADIAKFQYYITTTLCLNRDCFSSYDILEKNKAYRQWIPLLKKECDKVGIEFACTSFCEYSAEDISSYVKSFKVASPEVLNISFLKKLALYGKPLILSTGKATQDDLDKIFEEINADITLLYCVSKYPALPEDYDLDEIDRLRKRYHCPVGLSDHCPTLEVSKLAIKKDISMIEKHFKINESCVDSSVSITPEQMKELVRRTRAFDHYGRM